MKPTALQDELRELRRIKTGFQAQNRLLENLIEMARSSSQKEMLKTTMIKTLEVSCELSGAEKGSLFLLNEDGVVTDSILTRGEVSSEKRSNLIGTVLDRGLAGWVRENLEIGLVEDAKEDNRWLSLPNEPYTVRSALAVPILRHKWLFGILTLIHSHPRHFTPDSIEMMQMTADQIALAIENAQLYGKLDASYRSLEKAKQSIETYSKALDRELEKGRKIQKDFLPHRLPSVANCEAVHFFQPAMQLSGDFYDVFQLSGEKMGVVIGDVSDKGVGAALFMALLRSLLRVYSGQARLYGPGQSEAHATEAENDSSDGNLPQDTTRSLNAIALANDYIAYQHGEEGMFATVFFGVIDPANGSMAYINAGHEPLVIINDAGITNRLQPTGPAVGLMPEAAYAIRAIQFQPGDILFGFTDGVTEAQSPHGELYTRHRFESTVAKSRGNTAADLMDNIKSDLFKFIRNAPQSDDITMLAIRWNHGELP
jgi:sigma-B regulation protein RsbU (phosphoserine phosphatase)